MKKTKNRLLSVLLAVALVISAVPLYSSVASAETGLSVTLGSAQAVPGESVSLELILNGSMPLGGATFVINFDNSAFSYISTIPTATANAAGGISVADGISTIGDYSGKLVISFMYANDITVRDFSLARINFKVKDGATASEFDFGITTLKAVSGSDFVPAADISDSGSEVTVYDIIDVSFTTRPIGDDKCAIVRTDSTAAAIFIPDTIGGRNVTAIDNEAFVNLTSLKLISIPVSVTDIGKNAFIGLTALEAVNMRESNNSFTSSDGVLIHQTDSTGSLASIHTYPAAKKDKVYFTPDELNNINSQAFDKNSYLEKVVIGSNVNSIEDDAFTDCPSLSEISVGGINDNFTAVDGVLFDKTITELIHYPVKKAGTEYTVPSSVTSIRPYAIFGMNELTKINIPLAAQPGSVSVGCLNDTPTVNPAVTLVVYFNSAAMTYAQQTGIAYSVIKPTIAQTAYTFNIYLSGSAVIIPVEFNNTELFAQEPSGASAERISTASGAALSVPASFLNTLTKEETHTLTFTFSDGTSIPVEISVTAVHAHEYSFAETKAANCTEKGSKHGVCIYCKAETDEEIEINPNNHNYGGWVVTKTMTCQTDGIRTKTCSRCDNKVNETITHSAAGHVGLWTAEKQYYKAWWYYLKKCKYCGEVLTYQTEKPADEPTAPPTSAPPTTTSPTSKPSETESRVTIPTNPFPSRPSTTRKPVTPTQAPVGTLILDSASAYTVDSANRFIMGVKEKTPVSDFLTNFDNPILSLTDSEGKEKENTSPAATGDKLAIKDAEGKTLAEYTVIILMDTNGDGKIKANDARIVLRIAAGLEEANAVTSAASDYNGDTKIKANDARNILRYAAGLMS